MKVLLVEDNDAIVLGLEYLLREEGFQFDCARTRLEAEQKIRREKYDICLLDISLPDGSGYDLCRMMQKEQDLPEETGKRESGFILRIYQNGSGNREGLLPW